ncbi:MAG: hypothetical protein AAGH90_12155 [Pseudomonadota bacterium]
MTDQNLPEDQSPISPFEYWMESVSAWRDFSRDASKLWFERLGATQPVTSPESDLTEDTVTTDLLRMMADLNLRHWQNTARYLSGLPAWMRMPNTTTGSALVDWFDKVQRANYTTFPMLNQPVSLTEHKETGRQPSGLSAPEGSPDDLTRIKGIGPKLSAKLNALGIYHFRQIAHWGEEEAAWVDDYLSFKGRVERENWISQAKGFSANGSSRLH